jgi:hypothetical protein
MNDFERALQEKIARNAELAAQRRAAEHEMDRLEQDREAQARRREAELHAARLTRHAELVEVIQDLTRQLRAASPEAFVVRAGWSASGEEFITKISTRLLEPARSLFVELDRDDDEVLVRWRSDVGSALELWRLLEVSPELLHELILQVADQDLWRSATRPPAFPSIDGR